MVYDILLKRPGGWEIEVVAENISTIDEAKEIVHREINKRGEVIGVVYFGLYITENNFQYKLQKRWQ